MALDKVVDSAQLDAAITATANAIRDKTGTSGLIEWHAETGFAAAVDGIQSGGGSAPVVKQKDVNFYDYDGTLLYSYTVAEAQALTELPAGPEHEGLVFQKWNWSLENVKALTRAMNIGALYTTDDGTTRLYIHLEEGRTSPMLGVSSNGTVTVDWGDGTEPDVLTGTSVTSVKWTPNHEYATPGDYVIRLTAEETMGFVGDVSNDKYAGILRYSTSADKRNYVYQGAIDRIELGNGITSIDSNAFNNCFSLNSITIPESVTSIGNDAFNRCYSLTSITIPDGVTSIRDSTFSNCFSLNSITIPESVTSMDTRIFNNCYSLNSITIPDRVISINTYAFYYCYSLTSITIPDGVTSITDYTFSNCYSLKSITVPERVTSIASNAFNGCYSLNSIAIPDGITSIGNNAFNNCYSLNSITIPESVTSINSYTFYNCYSLISITIPESVTNIASNAFNSCRSLSSVTIHDGLTSIGSKAFGNCHSLISITIPESVTSIGNEAFEYCYPLTSIAIPASVTNINSSTFSNCLSISFYDFSSHTAVPTLSATNAFNKIPSDCEIRVPTALYDEWIAATNWSTYASQIVAV